MQGLSSRWPLGRGRFHQWRSVRFQHLSSVPCNRASGPTESSCNLAMFQSPARAQLPSCMKSCSHSQSAILLALSFGAWIERILTFPATVFMVHQANVPSPLAPCARTFSPDSTNTAANFVFLIIVHLDSGLGEQGFHLEVHLFLFCFQFLQTEDVQVPVNRLTHFLTALPLWASPIPLMFQDATFSMLSVIWLLCNCWEG